MKSQKWSFLILLVSIFFVSFLISCGDDDEPSASSGNFSIDGTTYSLGFAYKENYGSNENGSYDVDISLTSKELDLQSEGADISSISIVYLDLNTNADNELQVGTYSFSSERDVLTMVDAFVAIDISTNSDGDIISGAQLLIRDGSVTVSKSGDVYTIEFSLTSFENTVVTGSFTGTLIDFFVS